MPLSVMTSGWGAAAGDELHAAAISSTAIARTAVRSHCAVLRNGGRQVACGISVVSVSEC